MKRFFLALFAILLIVLSALFYDVSSAKAISAYDGAYQGTNQLLLTNSHASRCSELEPLDVTVNWSEFILDEENHYILGMPGNPLAEMQYTFNQALDNGRWGVSQNGSNVSIYWTTDNTLSLRWTTEGVFVDAIIPDFSKVYFATIGSMAQFNDCRFAISDTNYGWAYADELGDLAVSTADGNVKNLFVYTDYLNYPEEYEGSLIPSVPVDPEQAQIIRPEYTWKIDTEGNLTVQYLKNVSPFLTGSNFWVINETTEDWGSTGAEIHNVTVQPAGWFNETFTLPGEGYYIFRIDHNQQLDSPPWPQATTGSRQVKQIWVEFYWDGESVVTGTTEGCTADVCNDLKNENKGSYFFGADLEDHGLTAFITAPLSFIQGLSSAECEPLTLPFIQGKSIVLPCLKPYYQEHANALLLIWQTVISGVVAYLVAINSFARIKAISSPKDDSIEVYKL